MRFDIFNPSRQLRRATLLGLSSLLFIAGLIFSAFSIGDVGTSPFSYLLISFTVLSAFVAFQVYHNSNPPKLDRIYVWCFVLLVSWAGHIESVAQGVYVWMSLFPIIGYLALGKKHGQWVSVFGLLVLTTTAVIQTDASTLLALNLILSYLGIWSTLHILEVKRSASESSLSNLASRDALTGVYNRHALIHNFERYRQESKKLPLSLLILDLDYFKQVNDKYGHDVGDKVLAQTAALLDSLTSEHLVYRIGGEEFCIALHDTTIHAAMTKAELIRGCIESYQFVVDEHAISLTASIGVYQCHHFSSLESVLQKADVELYRAKQSGRNQVMVSPHNEVIVS
nr:GGDEF domain-containing protein [Vibrio rhodolitus]